MSTATRSLATSPIRVDTALAQDAGLFLLRAVPAASMLFLHGWGKFQALLAGAEGFPDPLGVGSLASATLAVSAEVGASALLVLGLGTRLATVPLMITMLVAIFFIHAGDPWSASESAAIYLTIFASIAALGPGRFSLDHLLVSRTRNPA